MHPATRHHHGRRSISPLDIGEAINDVLALVRRELMPHHVSLLRTELAPVLPAVLASRVQMEQVIIDLVIIKHRGDGGRQ